MVQQNPLTRRWPRYLLLLVGILLAAQTIRIRLAEKAVREDNGSLAYTARPQNGWGAALHAEALLRSGDKDRAIAAAKSAIRDTPYAVVAVRTLAQSYQAKKQLAAAEQAWQVSSTLGWRDKPTQAWAVVRALSNGEAPIFAMRADALLRSPGDNRDMTKLVRQAMNVPQLRPDFLTRLAANPPWRLPFFDVDRPLTGTELEGTRQALLALKGTTAQPSRRELFDTVNSLILEKRFAEAAELDRIFIRRAPDRGSLIDDGGFDSSTVDYDRNVTPFDWRIDQSGASLDRAGGGRSVVVGTEGARGEPAVSRFVALVPGNYTLSYVVQRLGSGPGTLAVRAVCAASGAVLGPAEGLQTDVKDGAQAFAFTLPAGCGLVRIVVVPTSAEGGTDIAIDDFRLRRT